MNLYTIGHSGWDSWGTVTLQHKKLFTKEEFDDIVAEAHVKAYIKSLDEFSKEQLEEYDYMHNIEYFYNTVPSILIKECGFQNINIVHQFNVNSMASIKKSKKDKDEQMNLIRKKYKELTK